MILRTGSLYDAWHWQDKRNAAILVDVAPSRLRETCISIMQLVGGSNSIRKPDCVVKSVVQSKFRIVLEST